MEKITGFKRYTEIVGAIKEKYGKIYSNCYFLSDEMAGLIDSGRIYYEELINGGRFLRDEGEYYHQYLFVDPKSGMELTDLDRDVVMEYSYRGGALKPKLQIVQNQLARNGFFQNKVSLKMQKLFVEEEIQKQTQNREEELRKKGFLVQTAAIWHQEEILKLWNASSDRYDFSYEEKENLPGELAAGNVCVIRSRQEEIAAAAFVHLKNRVCSMWHIVTREEYRGNGLALALIYGCMKRGMKKGAAWAMVWVSEENEPARRLYEKMGFLYTDQKSVQLVKLGESKLI